MMNEEDIKRVRKMPKNNLHAVSYERQSKLDLLFLSVMCFIIGGILIYFII